jgi:hypothetical protein
VLLGLGVGVEVDDSDGVSEGLGEALGSTTAPEPVLAFSMMIGSSF